MKRLLLVTALAAAGCYSADGNISTEQNNPSGISTFKVEVKSVVAVNADSGARSPLALVSSCLARYGNNPANVPAAEKGTAACPYAISKSPVEVDLNITAVNGKGETVNAFTGPVSFRTTPGDLSGSYE